MVKIIMLSLKYFKILFTKPMSVECCVVLGNGNVSHVYSFVTVS